jgi:hypothetical protein
VLDLRVPKELKKVLVGSGKDAIPPGQLWKHYSSIVESSSGDPGAIMKAVRQYMKSDDNLDINFLVTALGEL